MPDAVAATFTVGNTPELPHVTVFDHGYTTAATFCVGGAVRRGYCPDHQPAGPERRDLHAAAAGSGYARLHRDRHDLLRGLATYGSPGADVQFYSFNLRLLTADALELLGPCRPSGITTIPLNAVVNHSWHISMTFGGSWALPGLRCRRQPRLPGRAPWAGPRLHP